MNYGVLQTESKFSLILYFFNEDPCQHLLIFYFIYLFYFFSFFFLYFFFFEIEECLSGYRRRCIKDL